MEFLKSMKTFSATPSDINHAWYLIDASGLKLGRLATEIAKRIRGKHKPEFTPHMDTGDYIVVVNADKVEVTGAKAQDKIYYRYSGYPGGLKSASFKKMQDKKPGEVINIAVKGMLPKGPLGRAVFKKLKVYAGEQHPHQAQQPQLLDLGF